MAEGISNGRRGPSPPGHQFETTLGAEPASLSLMLMWIRNQGHK